MVLSFNKNSKHWQGKRQNVFQIQLAQHQGYLETKELGFGFPQNGKTAGKIDHGCISINHYEEHLHKNSPKSFKNRRDAKKIAGMINIYFCLYCEPLYNSFSL